jgi:uncharacterized membrane-anchored protein YjiN (DUF445 family)
LFQVEARGTSRRNFRAQAMTTQANDNDDPAAGLKRMKRIAGLSLAGAAALYVGTRLVPDPPLAVQALHAAAEAAMVGGLADWFAVVALFRRPLGLPIPHTAIIPDNRERIGFLLGRFAQTHFLDPAELAGRLAGVDIASHVAGWLKRPDMATRLADWLSDLVGRILRSLDTPALRQRVLDEVRRQAGQIDLAAGADTVLTAMLDRGEHLAIVDTLAASAAVWLSDEKETVAGHINDRIVEELARRLKSDLAFILGIRLRDAVDGKVTRALAREAAGLFAADAIRRLDELRLPGSPLRQRVDAAIREHVAGLRHSTGWQTRLESVRGHLVHTPELERCLDDLWGLLHRVLASDEVPDEVPGAAPGAAGIAGKIATWLAGAASAIENDPAVRRDVNELIRSAIIQTADNWGGNIGLYIAQVVAGWDPETLAMRVEHAVGRHLQFIRLNGTALGTLVGLVLFLVDRLLANVL